MISKTKINSLADDDSLIFKGKHIRIYRDICRREGALEVWKAVKFYVSEKGISLQQMNGIIEKRIARIKELEKERKELNE